MWYVSISATRCPFDMYLGAEGVSSLWMVPIGSLVTQPESTARLLALAAPPAWYFADWLRPAHSVKCEAGIVTSWRDDRD